MKTYEIKEDQTHTPFLWLVYVNGIVYGSFPTRWRAEEYVKVLIALETP